MAVSKQFLDAGKRNAQMAVPWMPKVKADHVVVQEFSMESLLIGEDGERERWEPGDGGKAVEDFETEMAIEHILTLFTPKQQKVARLMLKGYGRTEIWKSGKLGHRNKIAMHFMIERMRQTLKDNGYTPGGRARA